MFTPAWLTARPIAHRGLHDAATGRPENSLAAFASAAGAGYPIELDVQLSRDGEAVVFHDETLERMTGVRGNVTRTPVRDITKLSLLGGDQRIPLLQEVLELIAGRVPLIVELKNPRLRVGRLEAAVAKILESYNGACAVSSFNVSTVAWLDRHLSHLPRGQNLMGFRGSGFWPSRRGRPPLRRILMNRALRPQFIGCHIGSLPHPTAERVRTRGIPLIVFTVRDREQQSLADRYADNMFFEGFVP